MEKLLTKGFTTIKQNHLITDDKLNEYANEGILLVGFTCDNRTNEFIYIFRGAGDDGTASTNGLEQIVQPMQTTGKRFIFKKSLMELGVEDKIASDWIKVRQTKRAAQTETAFNLVAKQIQIIKDNYGVTANDVIKVAIDRNWQGIKSEWFDNIDWSYYGLTVGQTDLPFNTQKWE